jgi:hypothetical protein
MPILSDELFSATILKSLYITGEIFAGIELLLANTCTVQIK